MNGKNGFISMLSSLLYKLCTEKNQAVEECTITQSKEEKEWERERRKLCALCVSWDVQNAAGGKMIMVKNRRTSNSFISWTQLEEDEKLTPSKMAENCLVWLLFS